MIPNDGDNKKDKNGRSNDKDQAAGGDTPNDNDRRKNRNAARRRRRSFANCKGFVKTTSLPPVPLLDFACRVAVSSSGTPTLQKIDDVDDFDNVDVNDKGAIGAAAAAAAGVAAAGDSKATLNMKVSQTDLTTKMGSRHVRHNSTSDSYRTSKSHRNKSPSDMGPPRKKLAIETNREKDTTTKEKKTTKRQKLDKNLNGVSLAINKLTGLEANEVNEASRKLSTNPKELNNKNSILSKEEKSDNLVALKINPDVSKTQIKSSESDLNSPIARTDLTEAQIETMQSTLAGVCVPRQSDQISEAETLPADELCKYTSHDALKQGLEDNFASQSKQQQSENQSQNQQEQQEKEQQWPESPEQEQEWPESPEQEQEWADLPDQEQEWPDSPELPPNLRRFCQTNHPRALRFQADLRYVQSQQNNIGNAFYNRELFNRRNNRRSQSESVMHRRHICSHVPSQVPHYIRVAGPEQLRPQLQPRLQLQQQPQPLQQPQQSVAELQSFVPCYPTALNANNPTPQQQIMVNQATSATPPQQLFYRVMARISPDSIAAPQIASMVPSKQLYPNAQGGTQFMLQPQLQPHPPPLIQLQPQPINQPQLQSQLQLQPQPFQQPQPLPFQQPHAQPFQQPQPQSFQHPQSQPFQQPQSQPFPQPQPQLQPQNQMQPQPQYPMQLQQQPQFQSQLLMQPQMSQWQQFQPNQAVQYPPLIHNGPMTLPQATQFLPMQPQPASIIYQVQPQQHVGPTESNNQSSTLSCVVNGTTYFYKA